MTTDKTIKSKHQPKQTNVTWIDLSGETPVEKHFINGKWTEIGGSGRGSGSGCDCGGYPYNQPIPLTPTRARTEEDLTKLPQLPSDNWSYDETVFLLEGGLIPNQIIEQRGEGATITHLSFWGSDPNWANGPAFWGFVNFVRESYAFVPSSDGSFMIRCYYNGNS